MLELKSFARQITPAHTLPPAQMARLHYLATKREYASAANVRMALHLPAAVRWYVVDLCSNMAQYVSTRGEIAPSTSTAEQNRAHNDITLQVAAHFTARNEAASGGWFLRHLATEAALDLEVNANLQRDIRPAKIRLHQALTALIELDKHPLDGPPVANGGEVTDSSHFTALPTSSAWAIGFHAEFLTRHYTTGKTCTEPQFCATSLAARGAEFAAQQQVDAMEISADQAATVARGNPRWDPYAPAFSAVEIETLFPDDINTKITAELLILITDITEIQCAWYT
jgi:hypothetical protein